MKIAYISSSVIPSRTANSIHVMKMCNAFAGKGHDVVLFVRNKKKIPKKGDEDIFEYYGVKQNFQILERPYRKLKYKYEMHATGLWSAWKSKRIKADLVYCRNITGCFIAAKLGLPVIFESHSPVVNGGKFVEFLFRKLIRSPNFKNLVVITHALKEYYEKKYPRLKGKIMVAPDAADPIPNNVDSLFLQNFKNKQQVGYIGHLYKGKGVEIILELAACCNWAEFHIIGGTQNDIEKYKNKAKSLYNVTFHGFIPPVEVAKYYKNLDVVLLPNQKFVGTSAGENSNNISQWTSPLKAFEYMAARKPIIASNLPVLREVLEHERNALLCTPDNIDEWREALKKLKEDKELAEKISTNAYQDFINNYTWEARAKKVLSEIE